MSELPEPGRWSVLALRYAARPVTRSHIFYRYAEYGEPDGPQEMTYYLWLLRNREQTILVDTGYSARGGARRNRGHIVAPLDALAGVGLAPGDVDLVVNTHLHYDHTGHLDAFGDVPLLVGATELDAWSAPYARRARFAVDIEPDEIAGVLARDDLVVMGAEHDVAPGIRALEVGGHSPGQMILVVEGEQAPVVLASDAVHFYEEVDRDYACGVLVDLERVYRAYDTIRTLLEQRDARLLAGHDPLVMERFPRLAGDAGSFAVRVA
jgi:glyoxylase-like metal-dependent hydrolase (beta-lactamase superfamily II)